MKRLYIKWKMKHHKIRHALVRAIRALIRLPLRDRHYYLGFTTQGQKICYDHKPSQNEIEIRKIIRTVRVSENAE